MFVIKKGDLYFDGGMIGDRNDKICGFRGTIFPNRAYDFRTRDLAQSFISWHESMGVDLEGWEVFEQRTTTTCTSDTIPNFYSDCGRMENVFMVPQGECIIPSALIGKSPSEAKDFANKFNSYTPPKPKTISQICIEADENKTDKHFLKNLWDETVRNKYKYPLTELHFIREHIQNYITKIESSEQVQRLLRD